MALKFNNIKSLFIVDDENPSDKINSEDSKKTSSESPKTEEKKPQISWSTSNSKTVPSEPVKHTSPAQNASGGEFNEQIFESLTKALANSNLPGEDYLEFVQAYKSMKSLPMDESLKVQAAFQTLSVKGLTIAKVMESADYYISVLENEKRKFYTALEEQGKGSINNKKREISDLEKINKDKAAQIAALTEEINKNQQRIQENKSQIAEAEGKLDATEKNFLVTFDKVVGQIRANVTKIQQIPPNS